jgi:hypothetical protein
MFAPLDRHAGTTHACPPKPLEVLARRTCHSRRTIQHLTLLRCGEAFYLCCVAVPHALSLTDVLNGIAPLGRTEALALYAEMCASPVAKSIDNSLIDWRDGGTAAAPQEAVARR